MSVVEQILQLSERIIGRSTFKSKQDRSSGAIDAEYRNLESAKDAAKRLHIRPWYVLQKAGYFFESKIEEDDPDLFEEFEDGYEWHHMRIRGRLGTFVEEVDYRSTEHWDLIASDVDSIQRARQWYVDHDWLRP